MQLGAVAQPLCFHPPSHDLVPLFASRAPAGTRVFISGPTSFFHYDIAPEHDRGWGCAYRCLQMIIANLINRPDTDTASARALLCLPSSSMTGAAASIHPHSLTRVQHNVAHTCDVCEILIAGTDSLSCRGCNFDVCDFCLAQQDTPRDRLFGTAFLSLSPSLSHTHTHFFFFHFLIDDYIC